MTALTLRAIVAIPQQLADALYFMATSATKLKPTKPLCVRQDLQVEIWETQDGKTVLALASPSGSIFLTQ